MNRKTSDKGKSLIKLYEGCSLVTYICPAGHKTIGYGHTGTDVRSNSKWTQAQAESALASDLTRFENLVNMYTRSVGLNQNQFDALVSFAYNLGSISGTLGHMLDTKQWGLVPAQIKRYIHSSPGSEACGGRCGVSGCKSRIEPGLIKRRAAEAELFVSKGVTG